MSVKFLHFKETKKISKVIDTKKQQRDNVITEANKERNKMNKKPKFDAEKIEYIVVALLGVALIVGTIVRLVQAGV